MTSGHITGKNKTAGTCLLWLIYLDCFAISKSWKKPKNIFSGQVTVWKLWVIGSYGQKWRTTAAQAPPWQTEIKTRSETFLFDP